MRTLVIYHEKKPCVPCADGFAAAWVARKFFKEQGVKPDFLGWTYDQSIWPNTKGYAVLGTDFNFSQEIWIENP